MKTYTIICWSIIVASSIFLGLGLGLGRDASLAQLLHAASIDCRWLWAGIPHALMRIKGVKRQIMTLLSQFAEYCFDAIETGVMPFKGFYKEDFPDGSLRRKMAGNSVMGPYTGCFIGQKHDTKARVEMNFLVRWWKCRLMCDSCFAENPSCTNIDQDMTYINFEDDAPWVGTIQTHEQYMANEPVVSPFSNLHGWRKEMLWRDWAHLNGMGFGRDLGGAFAKSMVLRGELEGADLESKLRWLSGEVQEHILAGSHSVFVSFESK